jgi:hypothetical protein
MITYIGGVFVTVKVAPTEFCRITQRSYGNTTSHCQLNFREKSPM